jgi:hypothetical protein
VGGEQVRVGSERATADLGSGFAHDAGAVLWTPVG